MPFLLLCYFIAGCLAGAPYSTGNHHINGSGRGLGGDMHKFAESTERCTTIACHPYTVEGWQDFSGWNSAAGGKGSAHGIVFPGHSGSGTGGHSF